MNELPNDAMQREALRQQLLLRALMRDAGATALGGWVRHMWKGLTEAVMHALR